MPILTASRFDLDPLRGSFAPQFEEWDRCAANSDTRGAKRVRREIKRIASESLEGHPITHPGFYVFVDPGKEGVSGIRYIGIAETRDRPIAGRIVDRLRDDSGLDTNLDDLTDDDFREVVTRRLLVALPKSGRNYVEKHLGVAKLFRSSRTSLLISCDEDAPTIRAVEKALIGSAAAAGASLFNKHNVAHRGPCERPIAELALAVISVCMDEGLGAAASKQWKDSLMALIRE